MATITKHSPVVADSRLYADFTLTYSEASTDVASNSSTISWSVKATQIPDTTFGFSGTTRTNAATVKVYINGTCVLTKTLGLVHMTASNSWTQSGTLKVTHNDDGNKTVTVSLEIDRGAGNYTNDPWTYTSESGSASLKLSFIARASSISCSSMTLGSAASITVTKASSSFTHAIRYSFVSTSGDICSETSETSISWTPPLELAKQIPKATSGTITLYCDTYYGGSVIGTKSIQVKLTLPDYVKPSFQEVKATVINPTAISDWGLYIQGKSKVKIEIIEPVGAYDSSIVSYSITADGFAGSESTLETDVLTKTGSIKFCATVTDSRGRTSYPRYVTVNVLPYSPPVFKDYSSDRCTADGSLADEGTCVLGKVSFTYSDCSGKNSVTTSTAYRIHGSEQWTDAGASFASDTAFVFGNAAISSDSSYDLRFTLTDSFGSVSVVQILSTAAVIMDFKTGGTGLAVGKVSEYENSFEVNPTWAAYVYGKELGQYIADKIYPVGSVYLSMSSTNPGQYFGGTWVQVAQGKFLLGASSTYTVGSTGGEATHTLTVDELPSHNHSMDINQTSSEASGYGVTTSAHFTDRVAIHSSKHDWGVNPTGGGAAHNNMPPYLVAYMFQRTK